MNDDRCCHIEMSPGQKMCTCTSRRVFLELIIELQAQHIAELQARLQHHDPVRIY